MNVNMTWIDAMRRRDLRAIRRARVVRVCVGCVAFAGMLVVGAAVLYALGW